MHTSTDLVERAIQTPKNLIITNLEVKIGLTESVNRTLRLLRFRIRARFEVSPFELHHGRKPKTELTNITKSNKSFYSDRTTLIVSVPRSKYQSVWPEKQIGEVKEHIVMARKRNLPCWTSHKSSKKGW